MAKIFKNKCLLTLIPLALIALLAAALLLPASAQADTKYSANASASALSSSGTTGTQGSSSVNYDADDAAYFEFSDGGISADQSDSSSYKIDGTELTIKSSGTYIVSGSCSDGSIKIKSGTTGVTLVLDGLSLSSGSTAAVTCGKSSGVTIVAAESTTNTLSDGAQNNSDEYPENQDAEDAVIKCKDGTQTVICGSGTLNINANGKNGIRSGSTTDEDGEASLTLRELTLNISADVNDAINAGQLLNIESGTLNISAADDALHCDYVLNVGSIDAGSDGPVINISACYEGLEAAELNIYSGNISIVSSDDCLNAANAQLQGYTFSMNIYGGSITAYSSSGDGFDSNGSMSISGGTVSVWTANSADNQPLDADGEISITGGTVLAAGGSSGMGMNMNAEQPCLSFGSSAGMGGGMGFGGQFGGANAPSGQPDEAGVSGGRQDAANTAVGWSGTMGGMYGSVLLSEGDDFSIRDGDGNIIYSGEAVCGASYLFFSSDELGSDSSCSLYSGSTEAASADAQTGTVSGVMSAMGGQPWSMGGTGGMAAPPDGMPGGMDGTGGQPGVPGQRP